MNLRNTLPNKQKNIKLNIISRNICMHIAKSKVKIIDNKETHSKNKYCFKVQTNPKSYLKHVFLST